MLGRSLAKVWVPALRAVFAALLVLFLPGIASAQTFFATSEDSTLVPLPNPVFIQAGDDIFVHVRNGPSDAIPFNAEITATVATSRGDIETVHLFETGQDSVFTGRLRTVAGAPGIAPIPTNGTLEVRGNDTITVTALANVAVTAAVRTNGQIKLLEPRENDDLLNTPVNALPTEAPELKLLTAGKSMLIRVRDDDQNTDQNTQETIQVVVTSSTGDSETVTLTETDADSGIFMSFLFTNFDLAPVANDGLLAIQSGVDSVIATYADPITTNGTAPAPFTLDVRAGIDSGPNTFAPNPLVPGADLRVKIGRAHV